MWTLPVSADAQTAGLYFAHAHVHLLTLARQCTQVPQLLERRRLNTLLLNIPLAEQEYNHVGMRCHMLYIEIPKQSIRVQALVCMRGSPWRACSDLL